MYLDENKSELNEADKRRATGQNILATIAVVRVCFAIVALFLNGNILALAMSIALSVALASGINWIRWFCVVGGGISNIMLLAMFSQLMSAGMPVYILVFAVALMLIDIAMLAVLAFNKKINEFIQHKQFINNNHNRYRGSGYQRKAVEYAIKEEKKPCPCCGEEIAKTHKFCPSCGGDIIEREEANMQMWREKLEKDGYGLLLANENTKSEVKEIRRIYGNKCCISYLKDKAQELGISGFEITADDLDGMLSVG